MSSRGGKKIAQCALNMGQGKTTANTERDNAGYYVSDENRRGDAEKW
jgi:hypothetical protein